MGLFCCWVMVVMCVVVVGLRVMVVGVWIGVFMFSDLGCVVCLGKCGVGLG